MGKKGIELFNMGYRYYRNAYCVSPDYISLWRTDGRVIEYYSKLSNQWLNQKYTVNLLNDKTLFREIDETDVMLEIM